MTAEDTPKNRVIIYGSCVSRDTFDFLDQNAFQLDRYIARQSLISAYAKPTQLEEADIESLNSEFQRRTIRDDFKGSLHEDLLSFGRDANFLLWDLTDERYGVWDLGGGEFVTRSIELVSSGIDSRFSRSARHVPFGSQQHMSLWLRAYAQFLRSCRVSGLQSKPVLIAPPWASRTDQGSPVVSKEGITVRKANKQIRSYARLVDLPTISVRRRAIKASEDHKWGVAPFHYARNVYEELATQLSSAFWPSGT